MANKRLNVLVYSGTGSAAESVKHCLYTLTRLLYPSYAVIPITGDVLIQEPWMASCALLVMPGGTDSEYCRTLNGNGNRRIAQFVFRGGAYLGLCAGGYYGASRCEFEALPGLVHNSDVGARAAELRVAKDAFKDVLSGDALPERFRSYFHGGGVFVDAEKIRDRHVEILASYTEELNVESGTESAALVHCKVGEANIILSGAHPEFAGVNLRHSDKGPRQHVVDAIREDDGKRTTFLKACLSKLKLDVNEEEQPVPSLSRLHLSSQEPSDVAGLVMSWKDIITVTADGKERIEDENETFYLEKLSSQSLSVDELSKAVSSVLPASTNGQKEADDTAAWNILLDHDQVAKRLVAYESDIPAKEETPEFDHGAFFSSLEHRKSQSKEAIDGNFGKYLLYGEVVTSTSTMLEKNPKLLSLLPTGLTATATTQVAGRGRGNNAWVSPLGALLFSTVFRHPLTLIPHAPVIFLQFIASMAVIQGVRTYDTGGYNTLPVRLKWPNDIYVLDPSTGPILPSATHPSSTPTFPMLSDAERRRYVKIGGALVSACTTKSDASAYTVVVGIGLNVANAEPTTSLNKLAQAVGLPAFRLEELLARILVCFEELYARFARHGWDGTLQEMYIREWLHSEQIIRLETAGGFRARIRGISSDRGRLLAEEVDAEGRGVGRVERLESDQNSFDFMCGLIRQKI